MSDKSQSAVSRAGLRPSRRELRVSLLGPVVIAVAIWLVALVVYALFPGRADTLVILSVALGLVIYLVNYLRTQRLSNAERIVALLMALPAVAGISYGLFAGQAVAAVTGVGLTLLLLGLQRIITVPFSYRMARRRFAAGDPDTALTLIDKSIAARPDFWESHQLRALIHLSAMQFGAAERDARRALELQPDAHPVYNTLGQLYLAEGDYEKARDAYAAALALSSRNPLYPFYLGLAEYRLENYQDAAEAFAAATRAGLPLVIYELQAYYYLGRCLEELGQTEKAAEVFAEMAKFKDGLEPLKEDLKAQPDFADLPLLRADVKDMDRRLKGT